MNRNSGVRVLVTILLIVCVAQIFTMASMSQKTEDLMNDVSTLKQQIYWLQNRVNDLESGETENFLQGDVTYSFVHMNWENGRMYVEVVVEPYDVTEYTRFVVSAGEQRFELSKKDEIFVGSIEYPIDEQLYETYLYRYEGETETESELIDWIGAGSYMSQKALCEFEGVAIYGNDRLTLAGNVLYGLDIQEKIVSAKWVTGEKEMSLENNLKGNLEINQSEAVEVTEDGYLSDAYVELTTESGVKYCLYPSIYVSTENFVDRDEWSEDEMDKEMLSMNSESRVKVILPDGKMYEMILYSEWE